MKVFLVLLIPFYFLNFCLSAEEFLLFKDLELVEEVDKEIKDRLPFFYNYSLIGGYFNMPSARMAKSGSLALGGGRVPPYNIYGINFQVFDHIELSGNYRVFTGIEEGNFGREGFGDDADRVGNLKLSLLLPGDGFPDLPSFAIGADDFIGTKRFHSRYVVATKEWKKANVEITLGWGKGRIKGLFGGLGWTPFRQSSHFLKNLSFLAEYDAIDYKKHHFEHPEGRSIKNRINLGLSYIGFDALQINLSSVRGKKVAASASFRYPLGESKGFFPKIDDPLLYHSPIDTEPLGPTRSEYEFAQELAYGLSDQGLDLYTVYLTFDQKHQKILWLKIVNNRYREEKVVKNRILHLLAAIIPSDISKVITVIEADGVVLQSYCFRSEDLSRYRQGFLGDFEMETLSPMIEAVKRPGPYDSTLLFQRDKDIWTFTFRPRIISFFGSAQGKFKYNLSLIAVPEGFLFDEVYYRFQFSYSIKSSAAGLSATDRLNPSQILNVRTDSIRYYQSNTVSMEQAFVQRSCNFGRGFFGRVAAGYFEPAYGGLALEALYYPAGSAWAVGLQGATVLKRRYKGIAFTQKIRKLDGHIPHYVPFVGVQFFLDFYYDYRPLNIDLKVTVGQFLAKDKGIRVEVGRYFRSGMRFSLWYTLTTAHDFVNGHRYHDKGFIFLIPLDMFLKQSSLTYIGYAMSAWLRDIGASAETGKRLYPTLYEQRISY